MSIFDDMTNLYSLSKTLRFELKPVGRTLEHMKANGIITRDEQRDKDYDIIKPLFDKLHDEFIQASLGLSTIDWSNFQVFYTEFRKKMKDKSSLSDKDIKSLNSELETRMWTLRKEVCKLYNVTAEKWKTTPDRYDENWKAFLKDSWFKILTESGILKVLKKAYKDTPQEAIIGKFEGFFTYFWGFNQNRENYYSHEDKSTAVSNRIVNQNLLTFCNNTQLFEKIEVIGLSRDEKEIFEIAFYNQCLTQSWIDRYNYMIWGQINESWQRTTDGINQRINQFNQQNKTKLPQLKKLYKQIWSVNVKTIPFTLIETPEGLVSTLHEFLEKSSETNTKIHSLLHGLFSWTYEWHKVWMSKTALSILSSKYFSNWYTLEEKALELWVFQKNKDKKAAEKIKIPARINFWQLQEVLNSIMYADQSTLEKDKRSYLFKNHYEEDSDGNLSELRRQSTNNWEFLLAVMKDDFNNLFAADKAIEDEKGKKYRVIGYNNSKSELEEILGSLDKTNRDHKNVIKNFADSSINILRYAKLFLLKDETLEKDTEFYNELDHIIQDYPATKWYDAIRNYMTQKPYSEDKMKLNFDQSTLLAWRDKNKETQNLSVLLKSNNKYYLAIMKKDNNKFFERTKSLYDTAGVIEVVEKMEYKLLPWPNKMLPKCLLPGSDRKKYGASDEVLDIYEKGEFKKWDDFKKESLTKLIDFYKQWLQRYEDWNVFEFSFKETEEYEDISQFYSDVEKQWYKISWVPVNMQVLQGHADEGNVYLFEISSKDFYRKDATKSDDLQTIYWKNIFLSPSNIKLNGEAEVFFRRKSIEQKDKESIVTKANQKEVKYRNESWNLEQAYHNQRYTEDKILFHVPITLGFGNKWWAKFNQELNKKIQANYDGMKIIGIDRGEKHLAFYSVIDTQGKIIEQGTLNTVWGINYEEKLFEKAKTRLEARQNWETIGNIKNLKEWYISQVVRKIADLVLEHNAVVVFEDLNGGFKRGRQKIEQSVYQKLELALAKKLNFLVNKNAALWEVGSAINAFQITPQVSTFGDIKGKQRGAVLYTRANYTSTTDPVTGFRKNLYLKRTDKDDMKRQIESFDAIGYDTTKSAYFFSYDPKKFAEGKWSNKWTVWSCVDRYRGTKDKKWQWQIKPVLVTDELNLILEKNGIARDNDILKQIKNRTDLSSEFYASLIWYFDVIMQVRNTWLNTVELDQDFIHSPVAPFFDTRIYKAKNVEEVENTIEKPTSGDANGSYNIARKGLMMLQRVKDNPEKPNLYISDEDWDKLVHSGQ